MNQDGHFTQIRRKLFGCTTASLWRKNKVHCCLLIVFLSPFHNFRRNFLIEISSSGFRCIFSYFSRQKKRTNNRNYSRRCRKGREDINAIFFKVFILLSSTCCFTTESILFRHWKFITWRIMVKYNGPTNVPNDLVLVSHNFRSMWFEENVISNFTNPVIVLLHVRFRRNKKKVMRNRIFKPIESIHIYFNLMFLLIRNSITKN